MNIKSVRITLATGGFVVEVDRDSEDEFSGSLEEYVFTSPAKLKKFLNTLFVREKEAA